MEPVDQWPSPSRKALFLEFALMCGILWIPALFSGISDYLGWRQPSTNPLMEYYDIFTYLIYSFLIIFVFWRNGDPLLKLGLRPCTGRDLVLAAVLLVAFVLLHLAYLPVETAADAIPGAVTHYRLRHDLSVPWETLIYLLAAFREEIFYRGYVCSRLRDFGLSRTRTAILSALAFASVHIYQGWALLPVHLAFGLVFAAVFLNYRSLWPLVAAHASYNLVLFTGKH
ncbi:MAG TPA: type II CAAX endopeptidase family protein [Opitutales bacterium]|nr:type II CAAX endopeptidase family protein [Opitutales bacterium]